MKKLIAICLLAALACAFTLPALAEENLRTMHVSGSATVALAADTASIQIGVNTRRETVREAQQENAQVMAAVLAAVKNLGIDEKNIVTSQFNVYSDYDYSTTVLGVETRKQYYRVQNNVTVTVHDLNLVGPVLDAAMEAGANTSYGISFSSTMENDAYQKALTRAVEDAMQKAQVLAAAARVELGGIVHIDAGQNTGAYSRETYGASNYFFYDAPAEKEATVISSGDVSVTAQVTLEYEIK